ncbi:MAG TPA: LuxR C-terminal-related transcriptional regulator [Pyrinomonadaceae bacterium]|jgi:DNA-binding CsgD family transcriptional regulator|nr:LuxR C-terminal-related transcriptional regulator [Pyrinomonadaceae bacterium]
MRKTIIIYGLAMAALIALLKYLEYSYFIRELSIDIYIGIVAVTFVALGIWVGMRFTRVKTVVVTEGPIFELDPAKLKDLGISPREYEVLRLISEGFSNQEISEKLFISLSTVKTHSANLFLKLDVSRRTQAVQKARELRLIG